MQSASALTPELFQVVITNMRSQSDQIEIPRKIWTRQDLALLVEAGLPNAHRLELFNGDLLDRMGKKRPHVIMQMLLRDWLIEAFGTELVETESPIELSGEDGLISEPEPDVILTKKPYREYATSPTPADISLLIEVADTTSEFDLGPKPSLYARAGIEDYWVINLSKKQAVVHRLPVDGKYSNVLIYGANEAIKPLANADAIFKASF